MIAIVETATVGTAIAFLTAPAGNVFMDVDCALLKLVARPCVTFVNAIVIVIVVAVVEADPAGTPCAPGHAGTF